MLKNKHKIINRFPTHNIVDTSQRGMCNRIVSPQDQEYQTEQKQTSKILSLGPHNNSSGHTRLYETLLLKTLVTCGWLSTSSSA